MFKELQSTLYKDKFPMYFICPNTLHHMDIDGITGFFNHSSCPQWLWSDLSLTQVHCKQLGEYPQSLFPNENTVS